MACADGGVSVVFLPLRSADFTSIYGVFKSGCAEKRFDRLAETTAYFRFYTGLCTGHLYGVLYCGDVGERDQRMAE